MYYVPFLSLENIHKEKPPIQIPCHFFKNNYEVQLIVGKNDGPKYKWTKINETLNVHNNGMINKKLSSHLNEFFQAFGIVRNYNPDLMIFHGNYPTSLLIAFFLKIFNLFHLTKRSKLILKLDWDGRLIDYPRTLRLAYSLVLFLSFLIYDKVSIETECGLTNLQNFPHPSSRFLLIPNTISDKYFPLKPNISKERENIILTVSRIMESKKIDILIRLFIEVNKILPNWKLVIVGPVIDGNYQKKLDLLVNESGSIKNSILFTGRLFGDDLEEYYKKASIFCLLSQGESFALARHEAIASGIPVLTSLAACGVKLRGALSVSINDFDKLKESLLKLMLDKYLRQSLVEEGQQNLLKWDEIIKLFM